MEKRKFVKITNIQIFITINFETLKNCSSQFQVLRKSPKGSADFGFGDEQMLCTVSETHYGSCVQNEFWNC